MTRSSKRKDRVAELIQRKLAQLIQQEIRDPRLPAFITISGVETARDLSHAKVYFTILSGDPKETACILNAASKYLRTILARTLETRIVPDLHFVHDESIEYGRNLSRLIDESDAGHPGNDEESTHE